MFVGSVQGFIGSAVSLPTGVITAAFLSRRLGPEQYGVLSVVCFIIIFVETAISLGFERATVKLTAESPDWENAATSVLQVQLVISMLATLIVYATAPQISNWLNGDDLAFYLRVYAVGIPFSGMNKLHQAVLVGRGHFQLKAWLDGSYWIVRMALIILLTLARPSVASALVAMIISVAIVLVVARIFVKPTIFTLPTRTATVKLWLYGWPLYFLYLCIHINHAMDLIFVKAGLPAENAGFFAAAKNLAIVPGLVTLGMTPVLLTKLSGLLSEEKERHARELQDKCMRFTVCLLPFAGMSAGAAGEVVTLIYGAHFTPAGPLLAVLIFGAVGFTFAQMNAAGLIAMGKTRLPLCILGPLIPLTMAAYIAFMGRFGVVGVAVVHTLAAILTAVLTSLAIHRIWQIAPPFSLCLKTAVLTMIAFGAALVWETPGLLLLLKLMVIMFGIAVAYWGLGELSVFGMGLKQWPVWRKGVR